MTLARRSPLAPPRAVVVLAAVMLAAGALTAPATAAVPTGFTDDLVTAVASPTAFAFTPDGRLLVTGKSGQLRVYESGALLATAALDLAAPSDRICDDGERGLLGVAVHPSFASNGWIYLYYTHLDAGACDNRVSRFTLPATNVVDPASELVLLDNLDSPASNHNAGDVEFGNDGFLYVTIGDGGSTPARAQLLNWLNGKVVRITDTGGIPPGNPYAATGVRCNTAGSTTAGTPCQEVFASGYRNPFRFADDPNTAATRFFVNDVGQNRWEEIDALQSGGNYGWSLCEGNHDNGSTLPGCSNAPAGHVPPIFEWGHDASIPGTTSPTTCGSITGGAFVPNGVWPGFDGAYLFGDFLCDIVGRLSFDGAAWRASDFASDLGSVIHLEFGPYGSTQALYYATFASGGQIRRIHRNVFVEADLEFHTVTPCRVVDTRAGAPLTSGQSRTFVLETCGVPAAARAVAVNLTAVNPSGVGHLTVSATDEAGSFTSGVNFRPGVTRANNAVLRLGAGDGAVTVVATGATVHLLVDVVGYFAP